MAVIERPIEQQEEAAVETASNGLFWERPISPFLPLRRDVAAFLVITLIAGLLRFWDLGARMLHHDESLHAVYSYYLYIGKGYVHDPMMHGPFLFELNALVYFLLGATDATARVAPAFIGTVLVALPYFLRDRLGRTGAIVASVLLAISPTILYYSRFIRHDIYQIFFMTLIVIAMFRYFSARMDRFLYLAVAATSLAFSDKEDTYFLMAIVLSFALIVNWRDVFYVILGGRKAESPATDILVLLGSLILPLFAAVPYFVLQHSPESTIDIAFAISFAVLFTIGMVIGLRWNRQVWIRSALLFWGIFVVLYTTFFSNPAGVSSGVFGALRYWIDQQGVARGGQPWFYYLVLLPMYEFLAVGVALGGLAYWLRHRSLFTSFLMYWCLTSMVLWGWASEKMPWMVIEMSLPFIFLAAITLGRLIESTPWRRVVNSGGWLLAVCAGLAALVGVTLLGQGSPFAGASPIQTQSAVFQWVALVVVFIGLVYAASNYWVQVGNRTAWKVLGLTIVALVLPFTIRAAWQVNYYHGDIPVEMLVYTQTAPDVGLVMNQIDDIAYRTGQGKSKLQVVYDSDVSWPFEWYLRDYTSRDFIGTGNPPPNAPVILAGVDDGREQQMEQLLGSKYVAQRYRLRWWFPEDTTYRGLTPSGIVQDLMNGQDREKLWRFLLYRETPSDLGSTDFMLFVRRDLAYGPWAAPQAVSQTANQAQVAQNTRTVPATAVFGAPGSAGLQFNAPKGIAIAASGNLFVADSQNNRIEEFTQSGQLVRAWGTKGAGNGQFNEPWGVSIGPDGNVYVADTWNHRIQVFDANGNFVRAWGSQPVGQPESGDGQFFGPRAVAFDSSGNVYVTDTGNKRVEKFDPTGRFLGQFGGAGTGLGFFNEPVGLATDAAGNFYVADTWNQRIEKFGPDFKALTSWPVAGWDSQAVTDKPYIAVDAAGNVYATDPGNNQVTEYGPAGQVVAVWGKLGTDVTSMHSPTGITVDPTGNVYVTDSDNNRVLRFAPIH